MFCIFSFIILCSIIGPTLILSIWNHKIWLAYFKWLQKAWGCVVRKFTLQKCEIGFKDEVKNSILRKIILKKPELVKPISIAFEVIAAIIITITTLLFVLTVYVIINRIFL